jgi:microcystin-dependent protein
MEPFIGQIICVGFNYAPEGWAQCNGQLLSIAQYTALFALLGTTYGGDGRTTFGLPDLRGRAPIGVGQGSGLPAVVQGQMAGSPTVTLSTAQMPEHTHPSTPITATVTNAGSVAVPVNTEESVGKVSGPTGVLSADAPSGTYTSATADGIYSGNRLPVSGTQVQVSGGQVGAAGSNQAVSIMQPYLGMNYIIATQGIFPSRP